MLLKIMEILLVLFAILYHIFNFRYYGRFVYMTIQNPGEIIYIPSHCKYSNYAVEDSFSFIKLMQTTGGPVYPATNDNNIGPYKIGL